MNLANSVNQHLHNLHEWAESWTLQCVNIGPCLRLVRKCKFSQPRTKVISSIHPHLERFLVVLEAGIGAELFDVASEADAVLAHRLHVYLLAAGRALGVLVLVLLYIGQKL